MRQEFFLIAHDSRTPHTKRR